MQDGEVFFNPENSLTNMLLQKEKELQDLSKMRISQLQDQLLFKEKTIFDLECQIRRLSEDCSYKANLLSQRDSEILELETTIAQLSQENLSISPAVSNLNSELIILHEKVESLEYLNMSLRQSQENFSDLNIKLQDSYSTNNKLKYELQLVHEKLRDVERLYEDVAMENKQRIEEISTKTLHIHQLSNDKERLDTDLKEVKNRARADKERMEREVFQIKSELMKEIEGIKAQKENSTEQIVFQNKVQCDKFQSQVKGLLEDNKKLNQQVEYYQNLVIEKEKGGNQEIYVLRKENMENKQRIEEISSTCRSKEIEIASVKDLADHWKNMAASRAEELFKMKQLQSRSEEKAECYQKELDQVKRLGFEEVQRLKRENETLLNHKQVRFNEEDGEKSTVIRLRNEVERLTDLVHSKEYEQISETIKPSNSAQSKIRGSSREFINNPKTKSKLYQVKSRLDQNFLKYS